MKTVIFCCVHLIKFEGLLFFYVMSFLFCCHFSIFVGIFKYFIDRIHRHCNNKVHLSWSQLQDNNGSSSEEEEAEEEDVDVALKKEVAQLQASGAKREQRFQALESGANNVIFIKTHNLGKSCHKMSQWCDLFLAFIFNATTFFFFFSPPLLESDKLVHHILSDLHTTKKKKSRVILRMLPVRS